MASPNPNPNPPPGHGNMYPFEPPPPYSPSYPDLSGWAVPTSSAAPTNVAASGWAPPVSSIPQSQTSTMPSQPTYTPSPSESYIKKKHPDYGSYSSTSASHGPQNKGLLGTLLTLGKEVGGVVKDVTKVGIRTVNSMLDVHFNELFQSGNVIQLVSRTTGRTLQILQGPNGQLVLDGLGGEGPQCFNALFTVIRDPDGKVKLHNNFNYLAIANGITHLYPAGPGGTATANCRFKVEEPFFQTNFVVIESAAEKGRHIAVHPNGQIKSALATSSTDTDTHFAVRLIYGIQGQNAAGSLPSKPTMNSPH